nr:anaerobic ribonucleoside-triphosphate reductase [Anaeroplasmataceae bacterium]
VENELMSIHAYNIARKYITYRYKRALVRKSNSTDEQILSLIECNNEEVKQENSNKNPTVNSVQRDYMAGEVSKDITKRFLLPEEIVKAHEEGIIHFHDSDYFAQHMHNCCLVNLEDMLQNGTVISETMIEKPKSFSTACNVATQIIAQVASSQYGGQSITLSHLAPFVDISRQKLIKEVREEFATQGITATDEQIAKVAEMRVRNEVKKSCQIIQYQVVTLMTTNGQAPFVTVYMYLNEVPAGRTRDDLAMIIEEMLHQRILGVKNEKGVYITPAFPKLIYVLEENNIHPDSEYYYLTELAAKCTAKRMVPDYISEKVMKELKINENGEGDCYPCMGCRSFLTPDSTIHLGNIANAGNYVEGKGKYYGRFNQGVVTLNLVDIACSSGKDMNKFWQLMEERLELCYRALMCRHKRLLGTPSDVAPILWQHGGLARLKKGEVIDRLLFDGYSTISLGYAGLSECVKYLINESHTTEAGTKLGLEIMQKLNDACAKWRKDTNIAFSVYGTPLESTTYKFAKCLQKRFGIIPGVTDKNYITNSYHVHVTEEIDAFSKLTLESRFQKLSPGGAVSYVEVPNLQNNIPAVMALITHIYDTIMYAELNTKSDFCQCCGYTGEIVIETDADDKLIWKCPNCGNTDESKLNVARRTCGYIGTQFWNQGRTQEIKERVLHL